MRRNIFTSLPEKGLKIQQPPTKCKQQKVARREDVGQIFSKPSGDDGAKLQHPYSQTTNNNMNLIGIRSLIFFFVFLLTRTAWKNRK
jgi:hypothetical protein